jgi:hypothetical protein
LLAQTLSLETFWGEQAGWWIFFFRRFCLLDQSKQFNWIQLNMMG